MSSSTPVLLVTGATGKVGCAVVRHLLSGRYPSGSFQVRAAAKDAEKLKACKGKHPQLEVQSFDYRDAASCAAVLRGVSRVFHVTTYSVEMLEHSKLFVDHCKQAGVQHVVHLGVDVPGHQPLKVGIWHLLVEAYIESRGFPGWTHLHPTFFMENLIEYGGVKTIQNKEVITPFEPDRKLTWVSTEDIGLVGAFVMANPTPHARQVYPLVADCASHAEFAELLSKMAGQAYKVKHVPVAEWYKYVEAHKNIDPTYLCGFCELASWVNQGGKGSPVDRGLFQRVAGAEAQTLQEWTQRHLADLKS